MDADGATFAYDRLGTSYTATRRPDPRIAGQLLASLGPRGFTLNVGAGAGGYEPRDRPVVAVEPSEVMIAKRPRGSNPALRGMAEALPFPDSVFAAAMAILTIHHWRDPEAGLAELRRVTRGPVAVLTWDASVFAGFWMAKEYVPASLDLDRDVPSPQRIAGILGGATVEVVPIPSDCSDGFYAAWWRRPHAYLDPVVRQNISGLARLPEHVVEQGVARLEDDLASGAWSRRHADLLSLDSFDAGYRLVVAHPGTG